MLALEKRRRSTGQRSPSGIVGGPRRVLTVWLFNMNWTALSFTSFLTLLYVSKPELRGKTAAFARREIHTETRTEAGELPWAELVKDIPEKGHSVVGASWR